MDTHVHQLSSGEEEEIDSTIKDKGKGKNQNTSSDKPRLILTGKKRPRRLSSGVWVHFEFLDEPDENGNLICKCKKCGLRFNGDSKNETGNLHRHLKNCKQRSFRDVGQMILEKTSSGLGNRLPDFDAGYFRELLSIAIVEHDMPFQFVEFKGFRRCFNYLHPDFKPVTRNTIKYDVLKMYKREKEKLKAVLGSTCSRIALTSDCWTSLTTDGYISLTAHYVDNSWCLQKKILNFSYIGPPHTGIHLCDHVYGLLKEWGIQKNIFSITLDNASSNDVFAENLKGELELINGGEFFHVRCCAHILNLIVQDGLKEIDAAVYKIRESAKYCKSSQGRKQRFLSCVAHVEIQSTRILQQDVPTRWNSTYMMLDCALYFKKALIHFQKVDANYVHCPSAEEWGRIEKICKFLKVFHDVTLAFSGTKYPTSNLYFHRVLQVRLLLQNEMKSSDLFMQKMACKMYEKFGKYWSEFSTFMVVAVVLDPRYKLQCVNWGYMRIYG
ncbi:zinc finger BED domain-containing protein RICESLEEPER 2-like [Chenopodium quinoa]|uniref:zinc finger BED domain-containing protein RICESLEEPER 2-like n=1 Tax=Chenopodium quinoa TaxID=63459 RepID=UPI000B78BF9B|nr:zinc finger BED domain-containing protein RICESLEEPER 2-like [Chenopodium quinoa]